MNKNKKTKRITLMTIAVCVEYRVHISRKLDRWKKSSYRMKNMKQFADSAFMLSMA